MESILYFVILVLAELLFCIVLASVCSLLAMDISCCCVDWQIKNGFQFESETDTEIIPKLLKMINDTRKDDDLTFRELVERAVQQLVSCYWTFAFFDIVLLNRQPAYALMHTTLCLWWLYRSSLRMLWHMI